MRWSCQCSGTSDWLDVGSLCLCGQLLGCSALAAVAVLLCTCLRVFIVQGKYRCPGSKTAKLTDYYYKSFMALAAAVLQSCHQPFLPQCGQGPRTALCQDAAVRAVIGCPQCRTIEDILADGGAFETLSVQQRNLVWKLYWLAIRTGYEEK